MRRRGCGRERLMRPEISKPRASHELCLFMCPAVEGRVNIQRSRDVPPESSSTLPRPRRRRRSTPVAAIRSEGWRPLLALLPLLAVSLGGATARWSQAVLLLLLGAVLLVAPPRRSLGRVLSLVLGALVLLALTAFLPARWFSWPPWRAALAEDFGVTLPDTLSPQPWLSAESTVLFLAGLGWFYLMAAMRWTAAERLRAGRIYAWGTIVLAGAFVTFYKLDIVVPFWLNTRHFGPFPNRNQTADFLAVGALPVLACAHARWRMHQRLVAVGWLVGWLVVAVAVFNNFSRAGIGILFAGSGVYLVVEAIRTARRRSPQREVKPGDPLPDRAIAVSRWRRGALAVSMILVLGSIFFLFGGDTLGRFQTNSVAGAESVVTDEFRAQIQQDAAQMTAVSPWCGVGLGNFAPLFALARHRSASPAWLIHPESDWLWTAVEMGWIAPALTLIGLAALAWRVWPVRQGKDRPLRTAAAMAVTLFALHGFVDVSAHRLGTALGALFLLGLAMPGAEPRTRDSAPDEMGAMPPSLILAGGFRVLGLCFVAVGLCWLGEWAGWLTLPGETGVARLKAQAAACGNAGRLRGGGTGSDARARLGTAGLAALLRPRHRARLPAARHVVRPARLPVCALPATLRGRPVLHGGQILGGGGRTGVGGQRVGRGVSPRTGTRHPLYQRRGRYRVGGQGGVPRASAAYAAARSRFQIILFALARPAGHGAGHCHGHEGRP